MNEKRHYCIYKHTNIINGKVYIGQTGQIPEKRWNHGKGYKGSLYFYNAIQKYGWENFEHEILKDGLTLDEANALEKEYIQEYNALDENYGYNIRSGGEHSIPSEESRRRMSESTKGEKNPNWGKHPSEETRKKLSEAHKGVPRSRECIEKMMETKKRNGTTGKGRRASEGTRKKMSESRKGAKNGRCRAIKCVETGIEYWGAKEAEEKTGIARGCITGVCRGRHHTAGGYHWEYVNK